MSYKQIPITIELFDYIMEHFSYHKEPFILVAQVTNDKNAVIDIDTTIKVNFPD